MHRSRGAVAGLLLLTIALGLASRRFPELLPAFIAEFAGDVLWATMVYWLLALVLPHAVGTRLGVAALGIAIMVECSQLYHTPWLDEFRSTRLGGLILGQGFLWSDLACYAVGVGLAMVVDRFAVPHTTPFVRL